MYHNFSTKKTKGKIIVPPVVKLRHGKVLVSRQYPKKKTSKWQAFVPYRIVRVWCFFSLSRLCGEIHRRCAINILFPWSLTPLLWSFTGQAQAVVLVRN